MSRDAPDYHDSFALAPLVRLDDEIVGWQSSEIERSELLLGTYHGVGFPRGNTTLGQEFLCRVLIIRQSNPLFVIQFFYVRDISRIDSQDSKIKHGRNHRKNTSDMSSIPIIRKFPFELPAHPDDLGPLSRQFFLDFRLDDQLHCNELESFRLALFPFQFLHELEIQYVELALAVFVPVGYVLGEETAELAGNPVHLLNCASLLRIGQLCHRRIDEQYRVTVVSNGIHQDLFLVRHEKTTTGSDVHGQERARGISNNRHDVVRRVIRIVVFYFVRIERNEQHESVREEPLHIVDGRMLQEHDGIGWQAEIFFHEHVGDLFGGNVGDVCPRRPVSPRSNLALRDTETRLEIVQRVDLRIEFLGGYRRLAKGIPVDQTRRSFFAALVLLFPVSQRCLWVKQEIFLGQYESGRRVLPKVQQIRRCYETVGRSGRHETGEGDGKDGGIRSRSVWHGNKSNVLIQPTMSEFPGQNRNY